MKASSICLPSKSAYLGHVLSLGLLILVLGQTSAYFFERSPPAVPLANNGVFYEPDDLEQSLPALEAALAAQTGQNTQNQEDVQFEQVAASDADDGSEEAQLLLLPPHIGQTAGLALDQNNHLVLFHRSGRVWDEFSFNEKNQLNRTLQSIPNATIAVIDKESGKLLSEHGKNQFYMPHGLSIDSEGNHWLTDVGSHQVHKLDKQFKTVMSLGEPMVPGTDDKHFCKPTDVAVASTGEFFVADGYCNSRIMKFDKEGKLIAKFGAPNSDDPPKNGEFFVPHSLALIEDLNLLCVADRENERVQCFSAGLEGSTHHHRRAYIPTGKYFTKAENIGRIFAIREKEHYLVGVTDRDASGQLEPQLFAMDMNTGKANTFAKGLENAHALAISDNGEIFVSQIEPNQIIKFNFSAGGGHSSFGTEEQEI